jgi:hypothetical protein
MKKPNSAENSKKGIDKIFFKWHNPLELTNEYYSYSYQEQAEGLAR